MDNLAFDTIGKIGFDSLYESLQRLDIRVTRTSATSASPPTLSFSLRVGKWRELWLFRINEDSGQITCSGGVTKVFFGHNVLVPRNEARQLRAIIGIVRDALSEIGIKLSEDEDRYRIKRVEITRHFHLPTQISVNNAISRLERHFKALRGTRSFQNGADLLQPGTVGIGASKSKRECRAYDPLVKLLDMPHGIASANWEQLFQFAGGQLRVETNIFARDLKAAGLDKVKGWDCPEVVTQLLEKRYAQHGLSVAFQSNLDDCDLKAMVHAHPTFLAYVKHWRTGGEEGHAPNPKSGSAARYKRFMREHGFNVNVPYEFHHHLAHGLHNVLQPSNASRIPRELKHTEAFARWWESDE